jgi:hypothetical protein
MECVSFCARIAKHIATLTSPRHHTRVHTSVGHAVGRDSEDAAGIESVVIGDPAEGMKVEPYHRLSCRGGEARLPESKV